LNIFFKKYFDNKFSLLSG